VGCANLSFGHNEPVSHRHAVGITGQDAVRARELARTESAKVSAGAPSSASQRTTLNARHAGDSSMFRMHPRMTSVSMRTLHPDPRPGGRRLARPLRAFGCVLAALLAMGCQPAQSTSSTNDTMFSGLFKSKSPSVVDPSVGAALVREAAFPAGDAAPPVAAYAQPDRMSLNALPPTGMLSTVVDGKSPAEAWVAPGKADGLALVNVFEPKRRCELWRVDPKDAKRLSTAVPLQLDANQDKWSACSAQEVLALPAGKLLVLMRYRVPNPVDGLYLLDATGVVRKFGVVQPNWPAGLPSRFLDNLQLTPDAVLAVYRTDSVRLGAERYVNRFDHLVLFSSRHPAGLEVARIGIDDGNVRDWRFARGKLWLHTSDDRGDAPRPFDWSLDLGHVL
jgi:hypothetical protein